MRECFLTTWSCPGGGKGTRDSLAENSFIISSNSVCLAGRRYTRRLTRRRRMGDTGNVSFSSEHIKQQYTSFYHLIEMITMINSPSERCSREIWRWCTQRQAHRGVTLNSICGHSGRFLPDRTDRADSQWEMTPPSHMTCLCFALCESWVSVPVQPCSTARQRHGFGSQKGQWKQGSDNALLSAHWPTEDHLANGK